MCFCAGVSERVAKEAHLELTSLLKLLEVRLALEGRAGSEENVLVRPVDVLVPSREPGDRVIVLHLAPLVAGRRLGTLVVLADVDGDLLGLDAALLGQGR